MGSIAWRRFRVLQPRHRLPAQPESARAAKSCHCVTPRRRTSQRCSSPMYPRAAKSPPIRPQRADRQRRSGGAPDLDRVDPRLRHRRSGRAILRFVSGRGRDPGKLAARTRKGVAQRRRRVRFRASFGSFRCSGSMRFWSSPASRATSMTRTLFQAERRAEDATAPSWHVYYVQNGQSADLENLLQRAFTPGHVSPTPAAPGSTAPGAGQQIDGWARRIARLAGRGQAGGGLGVAGGGSAGTRAGSAPAPWRLGAGLGVSRAPPARPTTPRGGQPRRPKRCRPSGGRRRNRKPHPHHRQPAQQRSADLCHAERILASSRECCARSTSSRCRC